MLKRFARLATLFGACVATSAALVPGDAAASDPVWVYEGRCFYADRYATLLAQGVIFADCDAVHFTPMGEQAIFGFRNTRRSRDMDFRTVRDGENWRIEAIRLRRGEWRESSGECTIYRKEDAVSTITCITTKGARLYAANLEVERSQ